MPDIVNVEGWTGKAEIQQARDGKISVTKRDLAGRVVENYTLAKDAEGKVLKQGSATEYNSKGQPNKSYRITGVDSVEKRVLLSSSHYDDDGRLEYSKDEITGATVGYGYDDVGRQKWVRSPSGVYTVNLYDNKNQLYQTYYGESDPDNLTGDNFIEYEYDDLGRQTCVIDQDL